MTCKKHGSQCAIRYHSNRYDHLGRRVQKITPEATHTYFYDGWLLVKEVVERSDGTRRCGVSPRRDGGAGSSTSLGEDSPRQMERYVIEYHWGKDLSGTIGGAGGVGGLLYVKINGVIYIPWYDAYGNIMGYYDAQGNVVAEYTYDAFGKLIASLGPMADVFSLRYSTKYFDPETEFYYYGYRFYSPELKRWITRDPIGEEGGVNLYAICENIPVASFDAFGLARMLTGALSTRSHRLTYTGEKYARETLRLINELNNRFSTDGARMFYAEVKDLVLTTDEELRQAISSHPDDVYIIAHGGIKKAGRFVTGAYEWGWRDNAVEGFLPDATRGSRFIPLSSLGEKLNYANIFGCYLSARVRRIDGISMIDSYDSMYYGLYKRISRYKKKKARNRCPKTIIIFEGENSGSDEDTAYMMSKYPVHDESYYEEWFRSEAGRISSGGVK